MAAQFILQSFNTPMKAEVRLTLPDPQAGSEVRGRLMGPRCRFAETVEVAYPFRNQGPGQFASIIPEPTFWDPISPFLYEGPIEIWTHGTLASQQWLRHCLRTLELKRGGLRINGQPLLLRGIATAAASEEDLLELRRLGYNALLAPAGDGTLAEAADRLGFLLWSEEIPGQLTWQNIVSIAIVEANQAEIATSPVIVRKKKNETLAEGLKNVAGCMET